MFNTIKTIFTKPAPEALQVNPVDAERLKAIAARATGTPSEIPEADMKAYFKFWKEITADNAVLGSHYFLLHNLVLGRDPKRNGFSPVTNKNKLVNGHHKWGGLAGAVANVRWSLKNDLLARQLLALGGKTLEWAAEEAKKIDTKE